MGCALEPAGWLSPQTHHPAGRSQEHATLPRASRPFRIGREAGGFSPGVAAVGLRRERDQGSPFGKSTPEMKRPPQEVPRSGPRLAFQMSAGAKRQPTELTLKQFC
jgi:hypothetical protein